MSTCNWCRSKSTQVKMHGTVIVCNCLQLFAILQYINLMHQAFQLILHWSGSLVPGPSHMCEESPLVWVVTHSGIWQLQSDGRTQHTYSCMESCFFFINCVYLQGFHKQRESRIEKSCLVACVDFTAFFNSTLYSELSENLSMSPGFQMRLFTCLILPHLTRNVPRPSFNSGIVYEPY